MSAVGYLFPLALGGSGLAAGGLMIAYLGGAPLLARVPKNQYPHVHGLIVGGLAPFLHVTLGTGAVLGFVLATVATDGWSGGLSALAGTLLLTAFAVSLTRNNLIDRRVARSAAGTDLTGLLSQWTLWNTVRTGLAVSALAIHIGGLMVVFHAPAAP